MHSCKCRRIRLAALAFAALAMALLLAWPVRKLFLSGRTDFVQLYTGAKLAGTGKLYDPAANYEWHERLFGVRFPALLHSRPPFYSVLLAPLGLLHYKAAYWLFVALNLFAAVWVFRRLLVLNPPAAAFGLLYPATYLAILWGQDVWLAAAIFVAVLLLLERGRDLPAGILLSLCSIKVHLFVLVPVALAAQKRWRALGGAVGGAVVLLALGFAGGGAGWIPAYWRLLSDPLIHRHRETMPNLSGLSIQFGLPPWFQALAAVTVVVLVSWISWKACSGATAAAAGLTGSYLVSYHAYPHDALMLLVAFAAMRPAEMPRMSGAMWQLMASPIPILLALTGGAGNVAVPVLALLALASLACSPRGRVCGAAPATGEFEQRPVRAAACPGGQ